jgi:type II secretory ATPase GspE/PulE/Tfp pilus assembly ATPase PilB-like protein
MMKEEEIQQRRRDQDESSTQQRAAIIGLKYLDTRSFENDIPLANGILNVKQMYSGKFVPLVAGDKDRVTQIGVTTSTPQSLIDQMRQAYIDEGKQIEFLVISQSGYKTLMRRFDPPPEVHYDDIEIAREGDSETIDKVSETLAGVSSEAVFNFLITQADKLGASDIHIENEREGIRIRMRVDGALHAVATISKERYRVVMGELARQANISSAASDPQSGHMQHDVVTESGSHLLNMRVETVPTMYGQDAVLRLFNFDERLLNLDLLGIPDAQRREIDEIISHPRGLVLMVGPTGSGKSTTLYSMLSALNTPDKKIITLEDPIEYGLSGISQIPIDTTSGGSFADGLRSVLRLDPDILMVGEIRDQDTARTAIQASITGHLVLSSFHANTTSAAFARMIDLIGVNPIFSTAVRLLIAQRLVRKLHDDSKQAYTPDDATAKYVRRVLEDLPDSYADKPNLDDFKLYKPVPTDDVPFGYKGRIVIMEQMVVDEEIQKFIRGDVEDIHTDVIEKAAKAQGMITLEQAGVLAALRGETTLEEVNRVI